MENQILTEALWAQAEMHYPSEVVELKEFMVAYCRENAMTTLKSGPAAMELWHWPDFIQFAFFCAWVRSLGEQVLSGYKDEDMGDPLTLKVTILEWLFYQKQKALNDKSSFKHDR